MKTIKTIFKLLIFTVLAIVIINWIIDYSFYKKVFKSGISNCQTWGHRGLIDNDSIQENSLKSYSNAISKGAEGIETDVFFNDSLNKFIVSHDSPFIYQENKLVYLDTIFATYKQSTNYWLDLKNLKSKNVEKISSEFNRLFNLYGVNKNIFVETGNVLDGITLSKKNVQVLLWIQYNRTNPIIKWLKKTYFKSAFLLGDFKGATIAYSFAEEDFKKSFSNLPLFMFHLNKPQEILKAKQDFPHLKVVLVDSSFNY